jgi:O-antigen/teichoic acid export membrane protein
MRLGPRTGWATGAHLTAGLAVVGLAGYVYVAVVGRVFEGPEGARQVSALVSLYLLVNIIGPGFFTGLEQETSRAVSAASVAGRSIRGPALRGAALAGVACAGLSVVVLLAWVLVLAAVFDGRTGMLAALVVAVAGSAAVYWTRGVLGGQQRFRPYALTFYVEGAVRLVPLIVLPAAGSRDPMLFAMGFAAASIVAAASVWTLLRIPAVGDGISATDKGMTRSFALLMGATALSQTIANLAPVVVTYRLPLDPVASSVFGSTFVLARVPLFVFAPVLAVLLPMLTRAAEQGRPDLFARQLWRTVWALLALGGVGIVAAALFGPAAVELLFRSAGRPADLHIALLAGATVLMMLALVLQPALVALNRQRSVTTGWLAGGVVFLAVLIAPLPPIEAALAAQFAGPLVVVGLLGLDVARTLAVRRRRVGSTA